MDKILDKIIKQVIVEATTRKRLTKQIDSDTILNKLIKQVITEAAQKVVISKLDNKVAAIVSNYGFGFKISANFPITVDQVRTQIQGNSQFGTNSPYNSYLNYTYFVGSNMHTNPNKKFVANVVIINAKRMNLFNSAKFKNSVKYLLEPNAADAVAAGYKVNTVGRKNADLESQHHKARGPEAVYNSTTTKENYNVGSDLIFIDIEPGYANLPDDLMTVLTKKGAALMSTSGSEVPGFMSADADIAATNDIKTDDETITADNNKPSDGSSEVNPININAASIKKQTFTFNMKDNADLKQFQDELKSKLKADPNNNKLTPNMKDFIAVDKMTGYYGPLTSRLIVDLKTIFNYINKDGKILEPDFQQILIDKMQSKIKLTEQFNFTDDQLKLITNASVLLDPVQDDTKKDATKKDATKKDDTKKDDTKKDDTEKVALTKAYQLCLDAAKDLRKITTTNPQQYWKQYLRWNGLSYRSNANEKGIAWFKSAWDKAWGTKLAAASKIRNTITQKNINELNRRKNDVIDMIRKGGSMTVYLRIQNPFNGTPTDFKIKWDYLSGIQNAAFKVNPKKTVTNKQAQDFYNKKGKYRKPIENPGLAD